MTPCDACPLYNADEDDCMCPEYPDCNNCNQNGPMIVKITEKKQ